MLPLRILSQSTAEVRTKRIQKARRRHQGKGGSSFLLRHFVPMGRTWTALRGVSSSFFSQIGTQGAHERIRGR
ncbi:hypothetical protein BDA96_04G056900 [Sorghum bicolor]|uniref:Uncharacterized protein n=1 Tax=Sorghum bicolor TaxID=4558 RepID=A0A921R224_SORBI|nr:hypothetical protein BDA96_04G056900 [Sorghum bicolor]